MTSVNNKGVVFGVFSILIILSSGALVDSAKILGIFHFPARSQHVLGSFLLKALAARGHQVTMLSPFPFDETVANYTDIKIDDGLSEYMEKNFEMMQSILRGDDNMSVMQKLAMVPRAFQDFGIIFLESPTFQQFLKSGQEFDLVIQLFTMNEAFLGIGHHFNAPTIPFCSIGASPMINHVFGNPSPYSMVPSIFLASTETFFDRMKNMFASFAFDSMVNWWLLPSQKELLAKYFPQAPPMENLLDNVNIALLNAHPAIEGSKPYMPNMIQIGGFHTAQPDPLPQGFQKFMDGAKDGVILFSLGSNVRTSSFPEGRMENIVKVLSQFPQRVILKHDGVLKNVPKNIMVSKWVPQTSILAHKNMKVFLTHSGLGGTAEAIYNAVPMVCIPFFGDQHKNADNVVQRGMGLKMEIKELDDESLAAYIGEVLTNPKYRKQVEATADFYRSQPIDPLDKAIYWVEHVIKHKGARHFPKNIGSKQPLYQYLLLDILGFIGAIVLTTFAILFFVVRGVSRYACKKLGLCGNGKANKKANKSETRIKKKN